MFRNNAYWLLLIACLVFLPGSAVFAQPGKAGKEREGLLNRLGLEKKKKAKKPPKEDTEDDEDEPSDEEPDAPSDEGQGDDAPRDESKAPEGGAAPGSPPEPTRQAFTGAVHRTLRNQCGKCHKGGGPAGSTGFVLSGSTSGDYRSSRKFVKPGNPQGSSLLSKGAGKKHMGGVHLKPGSRDYKLVQTWIAQGAQRGSGGTTAPPVDAPVPTPTPSPPTTSPSTKASPSRPGATAPATPSVPGAATSPADPATTPPPTSTTPGGNEPGASPPAPPAPSPEQRFAAAHEVLVAQCGGCHAPTAMAGSTRFVVSGDIERDLAVTTALVEPGQPATSLLLTKGEGQSHGGGATLAAGSPGHQTIATWITDLASQAAKAGPVVATDADGNRLDVTTGASPKVEGASRLGDGTPLPAAQAGPSPLPIALPFHLRLNGKFDFSYERRNFKDHHFGAGTNAFQTYHHFLFLSRSGADDPFGFNIELMTQQFYEFNARFSAFQKRVRFLFKAGKIMVPFGPEPLFHKSYGGRTGFDQQVLPVVWAQPGIAMNAQGTAGPVLISNDLYAVQGFALRSPDAILNLQGDVSSIDNFKVGLGNRLGLSLAPVSAWYSVQFNALGYDRVLFMQALDIEFWRWRGVPVVQNLVLGLGGFRADVSGGDEGEDYYHFGSYGWIGYYPIRWLYLQYRGGLRTVDNRRGLYFDDGRIDERDGSSHNVTVTGRYKGFYATWQWFWNLEKANEQDDDFMRFTVGYEF